MRNRTFLSLLPATLLLVTLLLLTTGCFVNPVTGRVGPSWQVPLAIPLIATEVTVDDLLKEVEFSGDFTDGSFHYSAEETFSLDSLEVTFPSVTVNIDAEDPGFPMDITKPFSIERMIDLSNQWEQGIEEVAFSGGKLKVEFNDGAKATINSITLNEKKGPDGTLSLAGITLGKEIELTIEGKISDTQHGIESITVTVDANKDDIASIQGSSLEFSVNEQINLDVKFPVELDQVEFSNVKISLDVKYVGDTAPSIDLGDLTITGLEMPEDAVIQGEGSIHFDTGVATKFVNNLPESIEIAGNVRVGTEGEIATISLSDMLEIEFSIDVPFEIVISKDIVYETEVFSVDASQASLEGLEDLSSSLYGELDLDYRMPVGAIIELFLSESETPVSDKDAILVEVSIDPAPVDENGATTASRRQLIPVELPDETRDLLKEQAYAQAKITIPATDGNVIFASE
ncbi:MAG: YdgA family protein, partial [Firmicutes bacterium]|nr:YdgA family protein [Bacillota bacterium]